jgi:hypothetical protein
VVEREHRGSVRALPLGYARISSTSEDVKRKIE